LTDVTKHVAQIIDFRISEMLTWPLGISPRPSGSTPQLTAAGSSSSTLWTSKAFYVWRSVSAGMQGQGHGGAAGGAHGPLSSTGFSRSDNGPDFIAHAFKRWCTSSDTRTAYSNQYHRGRTALLSR